MVMSWFLSKLQWIFSKSISKQQYNLNVKLAVIAQKDKYASNTIVKKQSSGNSISTHWMVATVQSFIKLFFSYFVPGITDASSWFTNFVCLLL